MGLTGCRKQSKLEQYRQEKHQRDSVALEEQQRSLAFYQEQLDRMVPQADSLMAFFKYEKNDKYQDHGFYVLSRNGLRVLVSDDARQLLLYRNGKRIEAADKGLDTKEKELYERAQHLQVVMSDIQELERRIARTSKEISKYQNRVQPVNPPMN